MTPEQAERLQELLRDAASALEDAKLMLLTELDGECGLVIDLKEAISGRFPENVLRDYAERCECYFEGPALTEL